MPLKHGFLARAPIAISFKQQVAAATLLTTNTIFPVPLADKDYFEFLGAEFVYDVVSTSGTLDIRNVPTATAATGGTSMLSAVSSLSATARIVYKSAITANRNTRIIGPGNFVSLILAGTLTGIVGLSVTVWLQAVKGMRQK